MKQRGGEIIGSGSQGCIFAPKLERRNEGGRVIASRSGNNTSISKVFYNKDVWTGEYKIMQTVGAVTGGQGVVILTREDTPFYEANNLNPENKTALARGDIGSACVKLREITAGRKYYVLNQPRILGDLLDFKENPGKPKTTKPPSYFVPAYTALMRMRRNGLVHMDIASRNIFYDAEQALIGDFGYTINLRGEPGQLNASLNNFAKSHGLDNIEILDVVDAFNADQLTPEAFIALSIMLNWEHKDRYLQDFQRAISQINRRFVEWAHDPVNPSKNARGYIVFNGRPYQKYLEVIENARTMNKDEFKIYAEGVLLKSDIKRYIIVITQFLEIPDEQKYELLNQILNHDNFNFFYELAGVRVPDDLAAGAGGADGGGGGGDSSHFNITSMPLPPRTALGTGGSATAAASGGAGGGGGGAAAADSQANNINLQIAILQLDSLLKAISPKEFEASIKGIFPDSINSLIQQIKTLSSANKEIIKTQIHKLLSYYESNRLKPSKNVGDNLNLILPLVNQAGGRRRTMRRRKARKTRKSKRV